MGVKQIYRALARQGFKPIHQPALAVARLVAARPRGYKGARVLDQAGWHTTDKLVIPPNITLLPLPPRAPELNPVENIWRFMRDNWLSNRVFKSYDDIVTLSCGAWNNLTDQPWRIMPIGRRQWAHRF